MPLLFRALDKALRISFSRSVVLALGRYFSVIT